MKTVYKFNDIKSTPGVWVEMMNDTFDNIIYMVSFNGDIVDMKHGVKFCQTTIDMINENVANSPNPIYWVLYTDLSHLKDIVV